MKKLVLLLALAGAIALACEPADTGTSPGLDDPLLESPGLPSPALTSPGLESPSMMESPSPLAS